MIVALCVLATVPAAGGATSEARHRYLADVTLRIKAYRVFSDASIILGERPIVNVDTKGRETERGCRPPRRPCPLSGLLSTHPQGSRFDTKGWGERSSSRPKAGVSMPLLSSLAISKRCGLQLRGSGARLRSAAYLQKRWAAARCAAPSFAPARGSLEWLRATVPYRQSVNRARGGVAANLRWYPPAMVWEFVFLMLILKIPVIYLCVVVYWAIRGERGPAEPVRLLPRPRLIRGRPGRAAPAGAVPGRMGRLAAATHALLDGRPPGVNTQPVERASTADIVSGFLSVVAIAAALFSLAYRPVRWTRSRSFSPSSRRA